MNRVISNLFFIFIASYDHAALYASIVAKYHNLSEVSGRQIDDNDLRALGMVYNSTLTYIEFANATLSGLGLSRMCIGCPNLKQLLLTCEYDCEVTDEDVRSIAKCTKLERLSLARWTKITDVSIATLASLSLLVGINLSNCPGLTSAGVQSLLRSNGNIETIILSDRIALSVCKLCDDSLLNCIGKCCPKLRHFTLSIDPSSAVVSDIPFITLFQECPRLELLLLRYELLSDASLCQLAAHCPCMYSLTLIGGVYTGIIAVSSKCTGLTHFELHGSLNITDKSMISIAEHCCIKVFHLVGTPGLTDRGLCVLFKACTGLTIVSLYGLPLITDRSLLTIVRHCPKLTYLALCNNAGLTEKAILGLVGLEDQGGIEWLILKDCSYVTDETVSTLARHCSKLRTITLKDCSHVTVKGLIALLTHGERLTHIIINDCGVEMSQRMMDTHLSERPSTRRLKVELGKLGTFIL